MPPACGRGTLVIAVIWSAQTKLHKTAICSQPSQRSANEKYSDGQMPHRAAWRGDPLLRQQAILRRRELLADAAESCDTAERSINADIA